MVGGAVGVVGVGGGRYPLGPIERADLPAGD